VYEGARKFAFPAGLLDGDHDAVMLCIPVPLVPYFRRFFAQVQSPYIWKTTEDYRRAYPIFAEIEAQMAGTCASEMIESINRLYRLLDTSLNGTQYSAVGDVITPAIPAVPPASTDAVNALRAHVGRLWQLAENEVAGVVAPADAGIDGAPALADDATARQLLRRLITGVDGGSSPAPGDNLLTALRGTAQADANRNVIDKIGSQTTSYADLLAAINRLRGPVPAEGEPDSRADMEMLLAGIVAMRGAGPENTLKSLNQSIWNLAGPAPGTNLTQLLDAMELLYGLWDPGAGIKPYNLLDGIYIALNSSGLSQGASRDILMRIIAQFDTSYVSPTMKDLLMTISQQQAVIVSNTSDPLATLPAGVCGSPFVSTGSEHLGITVNFVEPTTIATWPTTVPAGFDGLTTSSGGIAVGQTIVGCTNWENYRIYVASKATFFGINGFAVQKFGTNQWITLSGNANFEFITPGSENLKVYICPLSTPSNPTPCPGYTGPMYGPSAITAPTAHTSGLPVVYWANGAESSWQDAGFVVTAQQIPLVGGDYYIVQTVSPAGSAGSEVSCCVAIEVTGTVNSLSVQHVTSAGELFGVQTLANSVTDDTIQTTVTLTCGVTYVFQALVFSGYPTVRMWVANA
jgi:hypothetical protein